MTPRWAGGVWSTSIGLALLASFFGGPAAAAADDVLLVSDDGIHFLAESTFTLFDDADRVVPGDRRTATVWLRNGGTEAGIVRLDLVDVTADDPAFAAAVVIATGVPGAVYAAAPSAAQVIADGGCSVLSDGAVLAPGETMQVLAELVVDSALTDRDGARATLGFHLRAGLSDIAVALPADAPRTCSASTPPSDDSSGEASDPLAVTGSQVSREGLFLATVGVVLGAGVLIGARVTRRRRDRSDDGRDS